MIARRTAVLAVAAGLLVGLARVAPAQEKVGGVLDFTAKDIDGDEVPLAKYRGKVLLIVNTASKCGLTPQYEGLEEVYEKYKAKGFEVLAFPANEFGAQEPGTDADIKAFCTGKYKTSFPLFSKVVVKGPGQHPLYRYLTSKATDPQFAGEIPWNFTKFLVDKDGKIVGRFEPKEKPESPKVTAAIESALAK